MHLIMSNTLPACCDVGAWSSNRALGAGGRRRGRRGEGAGQIGAAKAPGAGPNPNGQLPQHAAAGRGLSVVWELRGGLPLQQKPVFF